MLTFLYGPTFLIWKKYRMKSSYRKTTSISRRYGYALEETHGKIRDLINQYGMGHFRDLESETLIKIIAGTTREGMVISLGGGSLLRTENIRSISQAGGRVVNLIGEWNFLFERIQADKNIDRPLASDQEDFMRLMRERAVH